jgi:lysozyme
MNVSSKAVAVIKRYEQGPKGGFAPFPYICPTGHNTVGWGHVILPTDHFTYPMDAATADAVLTADLNKVAAQVSALLTVTPTQDQFDALVLLAYNVGVGIHDGIKGDFADSTLLSYFNAGKNQLAAAEFSKWVYGTVNGVKQVLPGLVARRRTEATLFLTGNVVF